MRDFSRWNFDYIQNKVLGICYGEHEKALACEYSPITKQDAEDMQKEIQRLTAEVELRNKQIQEMIDKAANNSLAGYREMADKIVKLEQENEKLGELLRSANSCVARFVDINSLPENIYKALEQSEEV